MKKNCESCCEDEDIFRALLTAHWHPEENRFSSSLFRGYNISVSRKRLKNLSKTIETFRSELHNPPSNSLIGVGEIQIAMLNKIMSENGDFEIIVPSRPTETNPAHAEINPIECDVKKITKSVSKKIIKNLRIHDLKEEF